MENTLVISHAKVADAEEILHLQKLAFTSEAELYQNFSLPPMIQTIESVKSDFESYTFLKACIGNTIVGAVKAKVDAGTCTIGRLIVHPNFQNAGIGKKLMGVVESNFNQSVCYKLFTGKLSAKNISFYEKLGYTVCGESSHPGNVALVIMEKVNDKAS